MNLKDTYNRIAHDWYKDHKSDTWWIEGTDKLCSLLGDGQSVLDVGCGAGVKSRYLAGKGLMVTGIDFSEKLIDIAKRDVSGVEFVVMDMMDIGSLGRKFDAVFAQASLLHIPKKDIRKALSSILSALKDRGYIYVAVKGIKDGQPEESVLKENDYGYEYERFFSYFSLEELKRYFAGLGLDIVYKNVERWGKTDWIQLIGRKM